MRCDSNINLSDACSPVWDAIVIGAGVAGSAIASQLSKSGQSVLLVDSNRFPRDKVCGGCLNQRATQFLAELNIRLQETEIHPNILESISILSPKINVNWSIPPLTSILRSTLDTLMIQNAMSLGVQFLDQTRAVTMDGLVDDLRTVRLTPNSNESKEEQSKRHREVRAKTIVIATGLARSGLPRDCPWTIERSPHSRIGVQTEMPANRFQSYAARSAPSNIQIQLRDPSVLKMIVDSDGYVGICHTDRDMVDIAACIDPRIIKRHGSIGAAVSSLLVSAKIDLHDLLVDSHWRSTPPMTRRSKIAADQRVFLIGDALSYIEPFTGEGMSWALEAAHELAVILTRSDRESQESEWKSWTEKQALLRYRIPLWISKIARLPIATRFALRACSILPPIRNTLIRKITQ